MYADAQEMDHDDYCSAQFTRYFLNAHIDMLYYAPVSWAPDASLEVIVITLMAEKHVEEASNVISSLL